ncbi:Nucleotid_trans domain-containing protein, partial [Cephalotus follicularis]
DTDIMWLRNPFPLLSKNESENLQISVDNNFGNPINTGFYYIRSNNKTISLFNKWYAMKDNTTASGKKEQDVLLDLRSEGVFSQLGLVVRYLDTKYFSGFCQDSQDIWAVATVHANCCRYIRAKITDLTAVLRDWKRFKVSADHQGMNFRWTGHFGCWNSSA